MLIPLSHFDPGQKSRARRKRSTLKPIKSYRLHHTVHCAEKITFMCWRTGMVKVTSLLIKARSRHGLGYGVRAWTEKEIWCVKGMYTLKVVSSEKNLGASLCSGTNTVSSSPSYRFMPSSSTPISSTAVSSTPVLSTVVLSTQHFYFYLE